MGLRGIDSKPLSERTLAPTRNNPWDDPDLDRIGRRTAADRCAQLCCRWGGNAEKLSSPRRSHSVT